jgi:hypothetical protein
MKRNLLLSLGAIFIAASSFAQSECASAVLGTACVGNDYVQNGNRRSAGVSVPNGT